MTLLYEKLDSESGELSAEERHELEEKYNVRFRESPGEFMCFLSSKPGTPAFSPTSLQAFLLLLKSFKFNRDTETSLEKDLDEFFRQLPR